MPISNHQLTDDQLSQLNSLAKRCRKNDGGTIPIYTNQLLQRRSLPCNLLYYHQQQLIGFLSLFFFYEDACELTLMVDPAWRRQRIATRLISTILPLITSRELDHILCPSPAELNGDWLISRGFSYHNSEVQMQRKNTGIIELNYPELTFYQSVSDKDISTLVAMDIACFHTEKIEMENRFHRLLRDETYRLFIIKINDQPIGKAHLHEEAGQVQLSDIAILPSHQGRGFGQALVANCIQYARQNYTLPLRLNVESTNLNALHLYQKLGFKTMNTWNFWMIHTTPFLNCMIDNN